MSAIANPAIIVARFLKSNNYEDTLEAFIKEAGLPSDAGNVGKGDLTIEKIMEEKRIFDLSLTFERSGLGDNDDQWSVPAPCSPHQLSLPSASNVLDLSAHCFNGESGTPSQVLFATTADRLFNIIKLDESFTVLKTTSEIQDSPVLSCLPLRPGSMVSISSAMSGQLVVYDHQQNKVIERRRDHQKYVVKLDVCQDEDSTWVATAGWDGRVLLYHTQDHAQGVGPPMATLTMQTNPETLAFIRHPDTDTYILLVTRRDSTSLYYYRLPDLDGLNPESPSTLQLLSSQNLAPHSNAWIAFSPSAIAIHPTDPTLLAVATSAVPHMKLIIVRLLLPSPQAGQVHSADPVTQAEQSRAVLRRQDLEDKAIKVQVSTMAPQTPYSTPQVVWRPDGTGVWVNGDDGVLRGLEAKTGKIMQVLKGGHEAGSKIRSLWCGSVQADKAEEWVISGGFDRRLVVWRKKKDADHAG